MVTEIELFKSANTQLLWVVLKAKGEGRASPLQAWTGPEGFRRLRLPDFKTVGT
jgi:hypothetical protein